MIAREKKKVIPPPPRFIHEDTQPSLIHEDTLPSIFTVFVQELIGYGHASCLPLSSQWLISSPSAFRLLMIHFSLISIAFNRVDIKVKHMKPWV